MSDVARIDIFREQSARFCADLLDSLRLRKPKPTDGPRLLELVSACSPLDVNSLYCYLILCAHFRDTCVVAERGHEVVGFVSGYREPAQPDAFFCWQVAVAGGLRRSGLATAMLKAILSDPANRGVRTIEATVTGPNHASMRLFQRLASDLGSPCHVEMLFSERHFAPWKHDVEWLIRIGPFDLPCDLVRSDEASDHDARVAHDDGGPLSPARDADRAFLSTSCQRRGAEPRT
jgi:L-2,4-diaminobutyric acid acetyltransferase